MKIDYRYHGATASITLTSVSAHRSGLFFTKTVLSDCSAAVLKEYLRGEHGSTAASTILKIQSHLNAGSV
ncbi:hypothetical protein QRD25_24465 (plasmid) [Serratia marcescens]|uniref:hypothetical protein n=1 Tax=Serratia TaxID=613 RepID=UPI002570B7A4|nr:MULTISPECIES: hypothetical protein [Serratia]MDM1819221.1 hypothetical protein [Serratia ureilytica]WJD90498.1 hypothetical protein QRD25_24465 [Serratia marcescens]